MTADPQYIHAARPNLGANSRQIFLVLLLGLLTVALTLAVFALLDFTYLKRLSTTSQTALVDAPLKILESTSQELEGTFLEKTSRGYRLPKGEHRFQLADTAGVGFSIISFDRSDLTSVSLDQNRLFDEGDRLTIYRWTPLEERPFAARHPTFNIAEADEDATGPLSFTVELEYETLFNLEIWKDIPDFVGAKTTHYRITGFYFGTSLLLLVLTGFVYYFTASKAYLFYAIFLGFHVLTIAGYEGIYVGNILAHVSWIHPLFLVTIPLTVIFALKFLEVFLELESGHPRVWAFVRPFRLCFYPLILAQLILMGRSEYLSGLIQIQNVLVLAGAAIYPIVSGIVAVNGRREHQLIYVAFIPHFLAVALYTTQVLGWMDPDPLFYYKLLSSTFMEMLLIAVALGFLMQSLRQEKESANRDAVKNLKRAISAEESYRTKLEKEVKERTAELERNDQKNKQLLEIISHDLRAPLWSLNALSRMTLEDCEAGETVEYAKALRGITEASQLLFDLSDNLLTWIRASWESMETDAENLDPVAAIQFCLALYEPSFTEANLKVETDFSAADFVTVDSQMLQTLLRNIFSNACRHTQSGGFVSIKTTLHQNRAIVVEVKNGPQRIPQEIADLINGDLPGEGPASLDQSRGLGLKLCKAMSTHNGWDFRIEPVSCGTRVTFQVPLSSAER